MGRLTRSLYEEIVGEILAEYDGSATPVFQASYIATGLDNYISMTRGGSLYYFHADALQSVWVITNSSETVQNSYQYQAFGSLYGTVSNPYRFTGRIWDGRVAGSARHPRIGAIALL